ncbi:ABC-2 type transport system ATP-binding protein [Arcanobacterium pluranimalium]|uniref:ABC transporter ATP-binding protein n=1 Tax=Arcanobacterium pluranimalium TaxID=108028 RepID=UPI001EF7FD53|nr:ATP-binding cassette domain-containing protein [Arcanobacterium pluranimalium]MBM7824778.1 ABC-2 type transport system ATP-binding protein [Arcanobacterium pluranimalium]
MTILINDLHKAFGSTKALNGMTFSVKPGELFGFVGSNGAGKTTTMRIILGVLQADSGEVLLDGKPLTFANRQHFGYMPEERGLYPRMKVGEQLEYLAILQGLTPADARKAMEYWTERLGVAGRRKDQVQALSLGNQQRVQLAAALIHNPQVLVLDEPFSGLDPLAVNAMSEVLKEKIAEGATVVFSSHQLDLVERLCDRVGICSQGRIVSEGSIDELRTTDQRLYTISSDAGAAALEQALLPLGVAAQTLAHDSVRVSLPQGVDDQAVLRAALDLAPVREFSVYRPHLNELFSNVVSIPANNENSTEEITPPKRGLAAIFGRK